MSVHEFICLYMALWVSLRTAQEEATAQDDVDVNALSNQQKAHPELHVVS